jgi:nitrate/TMAO reductase-like tetraheme cytochrome c subunit
MTAFSAAIGIFIALAAVLAVLLARRPELTRARGGKILAFVALFLLPAGASWTGFSRQIEHSKETDFCLSCHVMGDFGRSLYIDDPNSLPATHFQNNRIPRATACYTCHTTYTLFGDAGSKWKGLRHLYVQYLGAVPAPEQIKLYRPFNNRECLHCHAGARSFEEASTHQSDPAILEELKANRISCLTCHDVVHEIAKLDDYSVWKGPVPLSCFFLWVSPWCSVVPHSTCTPWFRNLEASNDPRPVAGQLATEIHRKKIPKTGLSIGERSVVASVILAIYLILR